MALSSPPLSRPRCCRCRRVQDVSLNRNASCEVPSSVLLHSVLGDERPPPSMSMHMQYQGQTAKRPRGSRISFDSEVSGSLSFALSAECDRPR